MSTPINSHVEGPILVCAAVIRRGEQILIAKRRHDSSVAAGKWEFPGGKVEPGEHPESTLVREIREELSCDVTVEQFIMMTSHVYLQPKKSVHIVLLSYFCRLASGEAASVQVADVAWITREQLSDYDFAEADLPVVQLLRETAGK